MLALFQHNPKTLRAHVSASCKERCIDSQVFTQFSHSLWKCWILGCISKCQCFHYWCLEGYFDCNNWYITNSTLPDINIFNTQVTYIQPKEWFYLLFMFTSIQCLYTDGPWVVPRDWSLPSLIRSIIWAATCTNRQSSLRKRLCSLCSSLHELFKQLCTHTETWPALWGQ